MQNLLPLMCVLICPVGMGLMMWLLMRKDQPSAAAPKQADRQISTLKAASSGFGKE